MNFNLQHIAQLRVQHQHIDQPVLIKPEEIVSYLGAVQAQDFDMCKWAVALRLKEGTETLVEDAMNSGELIRSHILRPTWHLVAKQDYRWMLDLSAPQLRRVSNSYNKSVDLDEATLKKSSKIIAKLLTNHNHLTRDEIMTALANKGINSDSYRSAFIMYHAELNGLVVNGARKGKQLTYALLDERIPDSKKIDRDEALAKLAMQYFTSHAPATVNDFSWWSGLNLSDCRKAIQLLNHSINKIEVNGMEYYFTQSDLHINKTNNELHILPAFDELLVSYANRTPNLNEEKTRDIITVNGIFKPFILHKSQVIGSWKRISKPKHIEIETKPFDKVSINLNRSIQKRFQHYLNYLNQKEIRFVN